MTNFKLLQEMLTNSRSDEERVTNLLKGIGFKSSLLGFEYIKQAVLLLLKDPYFYNVKITSELYPRIAKISNSVSTASVERGIRHSIKELVDRKCSLTDENQKIIFYVLCETLGNRKISNSEWIFAITRFLK